MSKNETSVEAPLDLRTAVAALDRIETTLSISGAAKGSDACAEIAEVIRSVLDRPEIPDIVAGAGPDAGTLSPNLVGLKIGGRFRVSEEALWQVTDIGTRTLNAVRVEEVDGWEENWLNGPPYALAEVVFDENDFPVLSKVGD